MDMQNGGLDYCFCYHDGSSKHKEGTNYEAVP